MRVLLITYHFPPDAAIGGVRPYQFARLLAEHDIETWVLTVKPQFAEQRDDRLLIEGLPAARVVRTTVYPTRRERLIKLAAGLKARLRGKFKPAPGNHQVASSGAQYTLPPPTTSWSQRWLMAWIFFPDRFAGWYRPALSAAEKLLRQMPFDAIVSTSPPRVTHFLAYQLALRHNLPWVMDLRDPWYKDTDAVESKTIDDLYQWLFIKYAGQADAIVMNTERLRQHIIHNVPAIAAKAITIPNGASVQPRVPTAAPAPRQFHIGHYGSVYSSRSAEAFLCGLRLWLNRSGVKSTDVAVRFMGPEFSATPQQIERLNLQSLVSLCPPISRNQVTELMREDYILLLLANDQPLQIPGKLYEYLAAGRRVLASTETDGATADLLRAAPGCAIVQSADDVAGALEKYWQEYQQGSSAEVDYGALLGECSYERRTASLAQVIKDVTSKRASAPRELS